MNYSILGPEDEGLHKVGEGKHWQESWYFNWADERHNLFGLTRIGYRFHQKQIDGLIVAIRDGKPEYFYAAVNIRHKGDWSEFTPEKGIRAKNLVYKVEEPMKKWRLTLEGKNAMDLVWESYTPVFDYHAIKRDIPSNVADRHFEQCGSVTGWTRFKGRELEIKGYGQRDKSWGVREWSSVKGWNWISAQFGLDLGFNVWEGFLGEKIYYNGFVFIDGKNYPVEKAVINYKWGKRKHEPERGELEITYGSGDILKVHITVFGHFPLVKNGLWIEESHAQFTTELKGKSRKGIGVIEHAYHVGRSGTLIRLPRLFGAMAKTLLSG